MFRTWNKVMALLTALDDLFNRTLTAIPGMLKRLEYLSSLRLDGRYGHWGLARVYGEPAAQRALAEAHKCLVGEVLRTPLQLLVEDSEAACATEGRETPAYLQELTSRHSSLLPDETRRPATTRHLSSVLYALSATRPDA
jgi:hypothetical protein